MGSVTEIIEDGVTGFIVDTEEEAIEALQYVAGLDRKLIRQRFEARFTSTTMAQKYVSVYERVIREAKVMQQAKILAGNITLQKVGRTSVVPDTSSKARERAGIYAAFQNVISPTGFLPRPTMSRQVSAYM